ncbi:MAG: hypothetical protein VKK94_02270 [Cyanobacteriota bacterium]|jgi:hypothetical protein|nr:hypothetical protein [Cyanobacteriota bacterium]
MPQRPIPWFWIALGGLLLLLGPGRAGRLLIDLLGGITLTLLLLPLLLGAAGWIGWQLLRQQLRTCDVCGFTRVGGEVCPACGAASAVAEGGDDSGPDVRQMTIDVVATDVVGTDGVSDRINDSGRQGPGQP